MRRTADRLDRAFAGRRLTGSDFRVPALATVDLTGATVSETATHGKHLLTRLVHEGHDLTLHTHLKMEGCWRTTRPGSRWPGPAHEARVVLSTERVVAIGFRLGVVELAPRAEEDRFIGHLGPDLLGPWTADHEAEAVRRLLADPDRPIGDALLDQRVVAGIGTIWLAECCFLHGIAPTAPVADLRDPVRLLRRVRQMMCSSVPAGRPVTTGDVRDPLWIYGRQRQPCRRCGTVIEAGPIGPPDRRRTTYRCPSCQPG